MKNLMLVTTAFIVSIVSLLCTQSEALPPPFLCGIDPDTGLCEKGEPVGACGGQSNLRCIVDINDNMVYAFEHKVSTVCTRPAYRPN
jgi:hypothetical protein